MANHRYTIHGSEELHCRIDEDIKLITDRLVQEFGDSAIEALVLIGGYGRGEGAVLLINGEEKTFNDYDFFLVTKERLEEEEKMRLQKIAEETTKATGIEVDLYPVDKSTFLKFPLSLMNCEMKYGSIIPYGNKNILKELPDYDFKDIPPSEGTRLLLNRGILLQYVYQKLLHKDKLSEEESLQLIKYVFKALLAIGDSYLLSHGKYNISYPVKLETINSSIEDLDCWSEIQKSYKSAVDFKLKVDFETYKDLDIKLWVKQSTRLFTAYFQWYEKRRLRADFNSWDSYAQAVLKSSRQRSPKAFIKNILLSIRNFGLAHTICHPLLASCYPRTRLYAMLGHFFDKEGKVLKNQFLVGSKYSDDAEKVFDQFWSLWLKYS